ncbi:NADH_oxidase [Hexamita inflata]|uniref:NADH oxidase n=1 Tax=Hexamita inflata TaxID=28002 RepID=A0AA86QSP0_9EUKA|nr:NADH oxidase [Hexamita inflata]
MKIVVIGCTHAGTTLATTIKGINRNIDITIVEKNNNISFLSCGIAIGAQNHIPMSRMFYSSVQVLEKLGVKLYMQHEAIQVDYNQKTVSILSIVNQTHLEIQYDVLVIASGSLPITPSFYNPNVENIMLCKNFENGRTIQNYVNRFQNQNKIVAIVGGGYIGVELCEAFSTNNFRVHLIEGDDRIMKRYFCEDITQIAENKLTDNNCVLHMNQFVTSVILTDLQLLIQTTKQQLTVDAIVLCIGFKPNTSLFIKSAHSQNIILDCLNESIVVDDFSRTSIPDVYAIGDCACCSFFTDESKSITLATNAIRQAFVAAADICSVVIPQQKVQGTSCTRVFGASFASTGITISESVMRFGSGKQYIYKTEESIIQFVCLENNLQIVGVQIYSDNAGELIQVASILVHFKSSLKDIIMVDVGEFNLLQKAANTFIFE